MARRARQARRERRAEPETEGDPSLDGAAVLEPAEDAIPTCPLCLRPIPLDARQSLHHLVPKLKGGARGPTVLVHQICHNEIHSALTEAELARDYDTPEKLRAHPAIARFVAWVADRDPAFHSRTVGNHRKRKRPGR